MRCFTAITAALLLNYSNCVRWNTSLHLYFNSLGYTSDNNLRYNGLSSTATTTISVRDANGCIVNLTSCLQLQLSIHQRIWILQQTKFMVAANGFKGRLFTLGHAVTNGVGPFNYQMFASCIYHKQWLQTMCFLV
jgi:hypothetical protein